MNYISCGPSGSKSSKRFNNCCHSTIFLEHFLYLNHPSPLYHVSLLVLLENSMVPDCHQCVAVLSRSKVCGCSTASGVITRMAHCLFLDWIIFITLIISLVFLQHSVYFSQFSHNPPKRVWIFYFTPKIAPAIIFRPQFYGNIFALKITIADNIRTRLQLGKLDKDSLLIEYICTYVYYDH